MSEDTGFLASIGKNKDDFSEFINSKAESWSARVEKAIESAKEHQDVIDSTKEEDMEFQRAYFNLTHWAQLSLISQLGEQVTSLQNQLANIEKAIKKYIIT